MLAHWPICIVLAHWSILYFLVDNFVIVHVGIFLDWFQQYSEKFCLVEEYLFAVDVFANIFLVISALTNIFLLLMHSRFFFLVELMHRPIFSCCWRIFNYFSSSCWVDTFTNIFLVGMAHWPIFYSLVDKFVIVHIDFFGWFPKIMKKYVDANLLGRPIVGY